jgi:hypothetical protein
LELQNFVEERRSEPRRGSKSRRLILYGSIWCVSMM